MVNLTPQQLVEAARGLRGTRWRPYGRSRRGVDCIGLVVAAYAGAGVDLGRAFGVRLPKRYDEFPQPDLVGLVERHCREVRQAVPGCLLLMRFPRSPLPSHFAIMATPSTILHAHPRVGFVAEQPYSPAYQRITWRRWLLPGVDYDVEASSPAEWPTAPRARAA